MDKNFDSIEELMEYVKKDMIKTIHRNSDEIEDVMLINIKQNVYNAYDPQSYKRRWENGGLYSRDNIIVSAKPVVDGVNIFIDNITKGGGWDKGARIAEIIEYGVGDPEDSDTPEYAKPRPFIEPTREDLEEYETIQNILKDNLDYIK